jgi:LPXTG-motif cell wall-anchored protein
MSQPSPVRAIVVALALGFVATFAAAAPAYADCYPPSQTQCSPSPSPSPSPSSTESPQPIHPKGGPSPKPSAKPTKSAGPTKSPKPSDNGHGQKMALSKSTVAPGESVRVSSSGWKPRSSVRIELHSSPVLLGTFRADGAGTISASVTIPTNTPGGHHTLVAYGVDPAGKSASVSARIDVTGGGKAVNASTVPLPRTGAEIALTVLSGIALTGLGGLVAAAGRRRRRDA